MRCLAGALCFAWALIGAVGCGAVIPLPVPATPTAAQLELAPRPEPPPAEVIATGDSGAMCGQVDLDGVARFQGHYNAANGAHYHGWLPPGPAATAFWVEC